jgi:hypothetical protein
MKRKFKEFTDDDPFIEPSTPQQTPGDRRGKEEVKGKSSNTLFPPEAYSNAGQSWMLGQMRKYLDKRRHAGLPKEVNLKALDTLMIGTLQNWRDPTVLLFESLKTFTTKLISETLETEDFERWGG